MDDVEDPEGEEDNGGGHRDQSPLDIGDGDPEEHLSLVGPIDPAGLQQFGRDPLDSGRDDHHGVTGLQPDQNGDQKEVIPGL